MSPMSEHVICNVNRWSQIMDTYLTQEFSFTPFEVTAVFCTDAVIEDF